MIKIFISIFTIMGPFLIIPTFISLTEGVSDLQRREIARKALVVASSILIVSSLAGEYIFRFLGISLYSFRIAGGILILLTAISMLHAKRTSVRATESEIQEAMTKDDISVFPLATPLIAGPGAISTVILYSTDEEKLYFIPVVIVSVILSSMIIYVLLRYSRVIYRVIGETGNNIMVRLMGLVLSSMAVEFIMFGIKGYIKNFK